MVPSGQGHVFKPVAHVRCFSCFCSLLVLTFLSISGPHVLGTLGRASHRVEGAPPLRPSLRVCDGSWSLSTGLAGAGA